MCARLGRCRVNLSALPIRFSHTCPQQQRVARRRGQFGDVALDHPAVLGFHQLPVGPAHQFGHLDFRGVQRLVGNLGKREQVVDQLRPSCSVLPVMRPSARWAFASSAGRVVLDEHLRKAVDRAQGACADRARRNTKTRATRCWRRATACCCAGLPARRGSRGTSAVDQPGEHGSRATRGCTRRRASGAPPSVPVRTPAPAAGP